MSVAVNPSEPQCPYCDATGVEVDGETYECPQSTRVCPVETFVESETVGFEMTEQEQTGFSGLRLFKSPRGWF